MSYIRSIYILCLEGSDFIVDFVVIFVVFIAGTIITPLGDHQFSTDAKISKKNLISFPLMCTCVFQRVRNMFFLEIFAYVVNGWSRGCLL